MGQDRGQGPLLVELLKKECVAERWVKIKRQKAAEDSELSRGKYTASIGRNMYRIFFLVHTLSNRTQGLYWVRVRGYLMIL